jgi:putative ABC transport system permease protein
MNNMIRFFKSTYRSLIKNKSSLVINLVGLSISFAFVVVISLWIYDELQIDKFHIWDKQLYQVLENHKTPEGITTQPWTPDLLARTLMIEMPEVKHAAAVMQSEMLGEFTISVDNNKTKAAGHFAEPDFFEIFSFKLEQGDKNQVLQAHNSIVISSKLALVLFNTFEDVIGKTIEWSVFNHTQKAIVTGVFEGTPHNSTMNFDFILSYDSWLQFSEAIGRPVRWNNHAPCTYLILEEGTDINSFNDKVTDLFHKNTGTENVSMFTVPYSKQYLHGKYVNGVQTGGRIEYVWLFAAIGFLILLIAGINFVNLTTACAFQRYKETGIKKILGSGRRRLIGNFVGESVLLGLGSLLLSFFIVMLFLPQINQITGKSLNSLFSIWFMLGMTGVCLVSCILSGIYPAVYLTGVDTSKIIKVKNQGSAGSSRLRNGLVVFQFAISMILILSVLFVYRQIEYIQNKNLGYQKENVVLIHKDGELFQKGSAFLAELRKIPEVVNASGIGSNLMSSNSITDDVDWSGKDPENKTRFEMLSVDHGLFETMEIVMAEGRSYSEDFGSDTENIILNQAAVRAMGLQPPVTGQHIRFWGKNMQIIGVCEDFHFESLHEVIRPMIIQYQPDRTFNFMVRLEAGKEREAVAKIGKLYEEFNPGVLFEFQFMDSAYDALYRSEQQVATVSPYFAGLGILLSCMGLFGLSVFAAGQRIKEIGIRKVNGAKISEILFMLNKDFIKWVLVSCILAFPVAWYVAHRWLESFAYRTGLSWWIFALAGILTVGVAVLTVSWQSWNAAARNPVEALRYE